MSPNRTKLHNFPGWTLPVVPWGVLGQVQLLSSLGKKSSSPSEFRWPRPQNHPLSPPPPATARPEPHAHQGTQTKPRPLGHSLASFPEGSSPADGPSFSSTHLGNFPVPLIPKQTLGKDGRKLTVPVPTSGRWGKSTTVPSRCQALSCVLYSTIRSVLNKVLKVLLFPLHRQGS